MAVTFRRWASLIEIDFIFNIPVVELPWIPMQTVLLHSTEAFCPERESFFEIAPETIGHIAPTTKLDPRRASDELDIAVFTSARIEGNFPLKAALKTQVIFKGG